MWLVVGMVEAPEEFGVVVGADDALAGMLGPGAHARHAA
jgi:hypothetical protein